MLPYGIHVSAKQLCNTCLHDALYFSFQTVGGAKVPQTPKKQPTEFSTLRQTNLSKHERPKHHSARTGCDVPRRHNTSGWPGC